MKNPWSSSLGCETDFYGVFSLLLWIIKHNFHATSDSLKGESEVLVHEYAQPAFWGKP